MSKLIHPVSGEVREVSAGEFVALFDPCVHDRILELAERDGVEALVCFENLQMDSSEFGLRVALAVGPSCTYSLALVEAPECRLGQLPSKFKYPTCYWKLNK